MDRLPYDYCRCEGVGCKERETCMRYVARKDMGLMKMAPITDNVCNRGEFIARIEVRQER